MSRRKQSRPRHVDNDGISVEADGQGAGLTELSRPAGPNKDGHGEYFISDLRSFSDDDNSDGEKHHGSDNEDICPPAEATSPSNKVLTCDKCGVCFPEPSQLTTHRKLCGSRDRILMPYDPPVENDYSYSDARLHVSPHKNHSDGEDASFDEDDSVKVGEHYRGDDVSKKRKRREISDYDNENGDEYKSPFRLEQRFIPNLDKRVSSSLQNTRNSRVGKDSDSMIRHRPHNDNHCFRSPDGKAPSPACSDDNSGTKPFHNGEDPAVIWAMKAAEKGLFGGSGSLGVGSIPNASSGIAQCGDRQTPGGSMPDGVSMFRSMLFQLQQQQMMQIQMIQQMRRQLIANGINPNMLPADIDLKLMSSESLASVGAAMSGLQNHRLSLENPAETLVCTPPPGNNVMSLSLAPRDASRCSSPLQTEVPDKRDEDTSSRDSESSENHLQYLQKDDGQVKDQTSTSVLDQAERNIIRTSGFDYNYSKENMSLTPVTRNPLEILQERTAASMSTFPLPLGCRSSPSTAIKSSSSSLLNANALFASSPSLSALQKETDALKPSPLLPPLSMPMTAEDYKGYIQRGTILERSQYASDDPFFKHKCRFCHKVFGSDSALQIHVRSHTGERPFKCNICGNRFSTKGNLKVHFERHKAKYPHIKMDATPVPEHFDKQPHLMPSFASTPLPQSGPLPPPIHRLPIPPAAQGPPSSLSSHITNPPTSHSSPFSPGFGGTFMSSLGPGLPHFGLMLPPRDTLMPLAHQLRMPFPPPLTVSLPPARDSNISMEFKPNVSQASVIHRSPPKDRHLISVCDNVSEKVKSEPRSSQATYCHHTDNTDADGNHHHTDTDDNHSDNVELSADKMDSKYGIRKDTEKKHENNETACSGVQNGFNDNRNVVTDIRELTKTLDLNAVPSQISLSQPSSRASPHKSPTSVISWASLASPQPVLLPGHHISMFPPHPLPPGFPGMGLPLPGIPAPFHLTSAMNHALPLASPRVTSHSPFLPPHPPLHRPQLSPPPDEGSPFRNSSVPAKTIDPSENLEQYMEVQKSETSKLEALVKNIEQKITDPNQCVVCHRVLSCKSALQMHYRIHTGERPFKCKICGRSFTTKGNLKTHMGVHRAKPALRIMHQCPVCHKQFTNVLVLQQHIRAHTGSLSHVPPAHFLPPHLEWPHQSPFNLHCDRPYLPPLPQSLVLPRAAALNASPFFRRRSDSTDSELNLNTASPKSNVNEKARTLDSDRKSPAKDCKSEYPSIPLSNNTEIYSEKGSAARSPFLSDDEQLKKGSFSFIKQEFESTFLPPDFGNTSFDTPLAALEERVKAIDSQQSQTSFQKFRNSMGLDCTFFPNSSRISSRQNSDYGSDSASRPASPALEAEAAQVHTPPASFDKDEFTCKVCFQILENSSALHAHYRSHDMLASLQCHLCDERFSTGESLHQHLATHSMGHGGDEFHDNSDGDSSSTSDTIEDVDDVQETVSDKYLEEMDEDEDTFSDGNPDVDNDQDEYLDDDFNEPPLSQQSTTVENNAEPQVNNCQNNNSDGSQDAPSERLSQAEDHFGNTTCDTFSSETKPACPDTTLSLSLEPRQTPVQVSEAVDKVANAGDIVHGSHTKAPFDMGFSAHKEMSSIARRPHVSKHQCMTCMKPFSSASALQIHTRTHTGDKPFKCNVCSKAFTTRGNLKVHMGTHMWNSSPSRRGRRMSIEPPLLLSHMKDHAFMLSGFHSRHSSELFYQYPLSMLNSPGSKIAEMPVGVGLHGTVPGFHAIPHHLTHGYQLKDTYSLAKDASDFDEQADQSGGSTLTKDSDITAKLTGIREASPSKSSTSSSSSSISQSGRLVLSNMSTSSTPSPGNNKENGNSVGFSLPNIGTAPWLWGALPCHHCGHIFPSQDSLEHHFKIHHLGQVESPAHSLTKSEPHHAQPTPKALVA